MGDNQKKEEQERIGRINFGRRSLEEMPDLQTSKDMLMILKHEALGVKPLKINVPESLEEGARLTSDKEEKWKSFWKQLWEELFR
jgi:hypothetical protein